MCACNKLHNPYLKSNIFNGNEKKITTEKTNSTHKKLSVYPKKKKNVCHRNLTFQKSTCLNISALHIFCYSTIQLVDAILCQYHGSKLTCCTIPYYCWRTKKLFAQETFLHKKKKKKLYHYSFFFFCSFNPWYIGEEQYHQEQYSSNIHQHFGVFYILPFFGVQNYLFGCAKNTTEKKRTQNSFFCV